MGLVARTKYEEIREPRKPVNLVGGKTSGDVGRRWATSVDARSEWGQREKA